MATYGTWESTVLEHAFDNIDFISLHTYLNNYAGDTAAFLASPDLMDAFIEEVVAMADAVAARRRSRKRLMLSFDEWNVWYRTRRRGGEDRTKPGWPTAPHILEEVYSMEDALTFGGACIALLNHADRVKSACLAQLVNAIAPIMTETGGPAWKQTIFFPFADMSNLGLGRVLQSRVDSPTYDATYYDPRGSDDLYFPISGVPYLKLSVVHNAKAGQLTVFALNRHLTEAMPVELVARGFRTLALDRATQLRHDELSATNTKERPENVKPAALAGVSVTGERVQAQLAPASWNVIRLKAG